MLEVLTKVAGAFAAEVGKRLSSELSDRKDVCRELLMLYVVLDELTNQATSMYQSFQRLLDESEDSSESGEKKLELRKEMRDLIATLKRFEDRLKRVFFKIELLDDTDLSIKLVEVPEASYSIFKKHLVDDLAPKLLADREARSYILRFPTGTLLSKTTPSEAWAAREMGLSSP